MLKNSKDTIEGGSLIINLLLIALNLLGMSFLVMGYHPSYESSALVFKVLGYGILSLTLIGIYILKGSLLFAYIARVLVGGLFIVSGLIKANDPKGFSYKLEEYFEDGALAYRIKDWFNWESFSLEFLIEHALLLSVVILILEIVLGIIMILGIKLRLSSWIMLLLMFFFTFLTWHTKECDPNDTFYDVDTYPITSTIAQVKIAGASYDENISIVKQTDEKVVVRELKKTQCVEDCGCFGDAMKGSIGRSLTPAESYWKDIVLLYLVFIIFLSCRKIGPNNSKENMIMIFSGLLFVVFASYIFSWYFPVSFAAISIIMALWIRRIGGKYLGNEWGMIGVLVLTSSIFTTYVLLYLPIKDYRPYHVGSNLIERMNDGKEGEYVNYMVYSQIHTGQDSTFTSFSTPIPIWKDEANWKFNSFNVVYSKVDTGRDTVITNTTDPISVFGDVLDLKLTNREIYAQILKGQDTVSLKFKNVDSIWEDTQNWKFKHFNVVYTEIQTGKDTALTSFVIPTPIWEDTENWVFKTRETKTIRAAILPSIQQFYPSINVESLTEVEMEFEPIKMQLEENQIPYVNFKEKGSEEIESMSLEEIGFFIDDSNIEEYEILDTVMKLDESLSDIGLKDYILEQEQVILVFARILEQGNFNRIDKLKEIAENAKEANIPMIMITTSTRESIERFRTETGLYIPTVQNDDIEIKAITRSNPTLMVLNHAVVKGKYPSRSIPSWKWLTENVLKSN